MKIAILFRVVLVLAVTFSVRQAFGQSGGPVPSNPGASVSAPVPGGPHSQMTHSPGAAAGRVPASSTYQQLPVSYADAQARVEELKCLLPGSKPQDIQESVYQLIEWLADLSDAHNRLALSFAKQESTKVQADFERQAAQEMSHLKNQSLLLKADLLIKQLRYPEALRPLVEIVVAEPKTTTGQAAYKRLIEIGFAPKIEPVLASNSVPPESNPANTPVQAAQTLLLQSSKTSLVGKGVPLPATGTGRSLPQASNKLSTVWITGSPIGGSPKASGHNSLSARGRSH